MTHETHRFGYDWRARFDDIKVLVPGEGSSSYTAVGEGAYWIVTDSGTLADFLDPDDPTLNSMIHLIKFDSRVVGT